MVLPVSLPVVVGLTSVGLGIESYGYTVAANGEDVLPGTASFPHRGDGLVQTGKFLQLASGTYILGSLAIAAARQRDWMALAASSTVLTATSVGAAHHLFAAAAGKDTGNTAARIAGYLKIPEEVANWLTNIVNAVSIVYFATKFNSIGTRRDKIWAAGLTVVGLGTPSGKHVIERITADARKEARETERARWQSREPSC